MRITRRVPGLAFVTADITEMLKMQHIFDYIQVVSIIRIETICGPLVVRSRSRSHRSRSTIYPFQAAPHPRGCR